MKFNSINQFFDHIYVISLERETDRHEGVDKLLDGLDFSYFYGVDKKTLVLDELIDEGIYDEEETIALHPENKPMNTGQIGRSWSHRMVYEDMIENNFERVLILEDEVMPNRNGLSLLDESLNQLPEDWELLYLNCTHNLNRNLLTWFKQASQHIKCFFKRTKLNHTQIRNMFARKYSQNLLIAGMHDCSTAYAITRSAAKKLVAQQTPICFLSNHLLAHACTNNTVKAFVFQPNIFQKHVHFEERTLIG